jgi:hypothetical protein
MPANAASRRRRIVAVGIVAVAVVVALVVGGLIVRGRSAAAPNGGPTPNTSTVAARTPSAAPTPSHTSTPSKRPPSGKASPKPKATPSPTGGPAKKHKPRPGKPPTIGTGATVPVEPVKTKPAVPIDQPASFGTGLSVRLTKITAVQGRATAPGEIAGPALRLDLSVHNGSQHVVDLQRLVIFVSYGSERTPAIGLRAGTAPAATRVPAEGSVTGRYVYLVPKDQRGQVRVEVSYSGKAPTVAFEGSAPQ